MCWKSLLGWIEGEYTKVNTKFDRSEWKLEVTKVPNQQNGYDCGVFTCAHIESI